MRFTIVQADLGPGVLYATYRSPSRSALILNTDVLLNRLRWQAAIRNLRRRAS